MFMHYTDMVRGRHTIAVSQTPFTNEEGEPLTPHSQQSVQADTHVVGQEDTPIDG